MFNILGGRECFYQWDLNQKLVVNDPTIKELHYSTMLCTEALICQVVDGAADVPNILLQQGTSIDVYGYCGSCYTKAHKTFKVMPREKPADYVYTETEVKKYDDLEKRIKELEETESVGGYYVPAVNAAGDLSWTATSEKMPPVETVNIKGADGSSYVLTDKDKQDIADIAALAVDSIKEFGETSSYITSFELGIYRFTQDTEIVYRSEMQDEWYLATSGDIVIVSQWRDDYYFEYHKIAHIIKANGTIESIVPYLSENDFQVYYKLISATAEQWTFELEDGTTITKSVVVK